MKKTLIEKIPIWLPENIGRLCEGAKIYDSSSSPEARVYFIDRDGGMYLKVGAQKSLEREALLTEYFHKKGLGAGVLSYYSGERDLMLTEAVRGDDCTARKYLEEPKRLAVILGERLRELHESDCSDCPVQDWAREYVAGAKKNYLSDSYDKSHFPDSFGYSSGEEAYRVICEGEDRLKNEVLLHGDYCLPNVMLDDWRLSGFIDLGSGGVGDRHHDLFWGSWTLGFNLGTREYDELFFDAYGRDMLDKEKLKIIAAEAVLG